MCHVTKYSTIRGVFRQPWPGVSPTAILNEEKALGMRLPHVHLPVTYILVLTPHGFMYIIIKVLTLLAVVVLSGR